MTNVTKNNNNKTTTAAAATMIVLVYMYVCVICPLAHALTM